MTMKRVLLTILLTGGVFAAFAGSVSPTVDLGASPVQMQSQDVVQGDLSDGLRALTSASGIAISFNPTNTEGIVVSWARGYSGDFESLLAQLLAGTNLNFKRVNSTNYYVYVRQESVGVNSVGERVVATGVGNKVGRTRTVSKIPYKMPWVAIKTNLLYDLTTTVNLGFEFGLARILTLDLSANYNPWVFSDNRKVQHVLIQPELRFWTNERFSGNFIGLHGHWGQYNAGGVQLPFWNQWFEKNRYNGTLWGLGVSYGYQWVLSNRINLEATIGFGYAQMTYDRYDCRTCGIVKEHGVKYNYFGPTKLGVSLIVLL